MDPDPGLMFKLQEKPLAIKREHPALQKKRIFYHFSMLVGHFCPPGSGYGSTALVLWIGAPFHKLAEGSKTSAFQLHLQFKLKSVNRYTITKTNHRVGTVPVVNPFASESMLSKNFLTSVSYSFLKLAEFNNLGTKPFRRVRQWARRTGRQRRPNTWRRRPS
jgi:hypothetical protein